MTLIVNVLTGAALDQALDDVAKLRLAVFRAYPYLYDGDLGYEQQYLQTYRDSDGAVLVGAFDGDRLVGASTGTPLSEHADDFGVAFSGVSVDLNDVFYCAESVLLPEYRGHGVGHQFFDQREAHAMRLGFLKSTFCSVVRPDNHPLKPENYSPLDRFWQSRGYAPLEGVRAKFRWKDLDENEETGKELQFWIRDLPSASNVGECS
ncbi:GNAT family N-acetyltransferase [Cochlodiniinecator piscidefendens]|uniref:GNAT family N-acetyltransferase n=1 Tax=Cochlodiniinecator piscidefendens TaxID=2715756 RepID=UPI0014091BF9|nr:GNAT family N-acetyltransferase [Cochlodiniinecator piscidefendens]